MDRPAYYTQEVSTQQGMSVRHSENAERGSRSWEQILAHGGVPLAH